MSDWIKRRHAKPVDGTADVDEVQRDRLRRSLTAPIEAAPRTAAGRALDVAWPGTHLDRLDWRDAILAIEAEAAQSADGLTSGSPQPEGLRAALERLTLLRSTMRGIAYDESVDTIAAARSVAVKAVNQDEDLARAALTSASPEAEGLSAEAPATALRDLNILLLLEWAEGQEGEGCLYCNFAEGHEAECVVALARSSWQQADPPATALTSASAEAEGLDVKRLAEAVRRTALTHYPEASLDYALALAAAYATPDASDEPK